MQSITAEKTIQKLRAIFTTHRIPHKFITDNGPAICSEQFETFILIDRKCQLTGFQRMPLYIQP